MKAIVLRELGAAENLKLEDAPDPQPGAGEAVVKLKAAALNHLDETARRIGTQLMNRPRLLCHVLEE